ncbi:DUF5787 family protein [Natronococcus occultus]|uniref:Uncharacterized protein n=1 Tax=Natronococcus occultus SP4 TaxID=694430 RepID=L0K1Y5_9EURY|nr:DUF5787 family protein [Natronococcus occultus]AGB38128.1 hypothetical protein Natoc_2352 [Natronococcus occultus SP4]
MSEFAFELELCAFLEGRSDRLFARQLGAGVANPGGRVLDIVGIEPGPGFPDRAAITAESIPTAAIESRVGPGRTRYWKDAFDCHPNRARRATERAIEVGFFERERRNGREYVRQVARYPDWYDRVLAIENKPDLGRPGDLEAQLRTDVSLGVVDEVVLATESYVTGAHRNRIPDEVGIWRVHREDGAVREIDVLREPTPLSVAEPGIEPLESHPGRTDIAIASPAAKARTRRRLAERAYGKGWRTYGLPACERCRAADSNGATVPYCEWAGRAVDAEGDCGVDCPGYVRGSAPAVDHETERDHRTDWVADPSGRRRTQTGLERFS